MDQRICIATGFEPAATYLSYVKHDYEYVFPEYIGISELHFFLAYFSAFSPPLNICLRFPLWEVLQSNFKLPGG